jgi:hypothetical protein
VTGSVAALLCGVPLDPGDLDVTPSLDRENLGRLASALDELGARQYAEAPFGRWATRDDGERTWVEFEPTQADRAARATWRPDPAEAQSFDHLLRTIHGALDVVPELAGAYEDLRARAIQVDLDGAAVWVESISDQLASLTTPRRARDVERVRALRAIQRGSVEPSQAADDHSPEG